MRVVHTLAELTLRGGVLAIGNFDGVHRGHRTLLARMARIMEADGVPGTVVTFFPPAKVLFRGVPYLASQAEKAQLLAAYRPGELAILAFTKAFAATDKQAFLDALARLEPHAIVVGEDFRFGRDRAGGLDDLQHVPKRLEVVHLERHGPDAISSSRIRAHLASGEIEAANALLGAPYLAIGPVVHGDHRGRTIGFPTANLDLPEAKALPLGVYAVSVVVPGRGRHLGMANVGPRPTFPDEAPRLEVHLLDFPRSPGGDGRGWDGSVGEGPLRDGPAAEDAGGNEPTGGNLYGLDLHVSFHAHLRNQRSFANLGELKAQLAADAHAARAALARLDVTADRAAALATPQR